MVDKNEDQKRPRDPIDSMTEGLLNIEKDMKIERMMRFINRLDQGLENLNKVIGGPGEMETTVRDAMLFMDVKGNEESFNHAIKREFVRIRAMFEASNRKIKKMLEVAEEFGWCHRTVEDMRQRMTEEEIGMVDELTKYYFFKGKIATQSRSELIRYAVRHLNVMTLPEIEKMHGNLGG